MSSIPVDSVHHIEDVGHLLLEAQRDLARVRQRLDAMPLESDAVRHNNTPTATTDGSASGSAALSQLRDLLQQTESQLRTKGEAVLRSVEDNRLNTLPAVTSASSGAARFHGDFDLASVLIPPASHTYASNALVPSPARAQAAATAATLGGLNSPLRRQASMSAAQLAHMRRPVAERMAEARALDYLARAPNEAQLGAGGSYAAGPSPARDFVQTKYGLGGGDGSSFANNHAAPAAASVSASGTRPTERYGRAWREQRVHKGPRLGQPSILPKVYRSNPRAFPTIGSAEADAGVLELVQRGFIPSFVDVTAAFSSAPAPLAAAPATFHQYHEQFKRPGGGGAVGAAGATIATHAPFNLSQVRLDLGSAILDGAHGAREYERALEERDKAAQQQLLLQEEKQQQQLEQPTEWRAAPSQTFDFPRLMPGSDESQDDKRLVLASPDPMTTDGMADDVEDLFLAEGIGATHGSNASTALVTATDAEPVGAPREYDELLDAYSLHQFLIRKGKVLSNTPEFHSFARRNTHHWGQVKVVLAALENLCRDYRIQLATVAGQAVAQLAEDELGKLTPEKLFKCFNLEAHGMDAQNGSAGTRQMDPVLRALLSAPAAARYAVGGEVARLLAALKIQSTWRMFLQRRLYLLYRFRHTKAILIQRCWRKFQTILRTRATIASKWNARLAAWREMQNAWKASYSSSFTQRQRVHIHIPSISTEAYQRAATFNLAVRCNAQLARLCDTRDPLVDVLYVAPFALSRDVESYYLKLLEVGGVGSGGKHGNGVHTRVKVMLAENSSRFPEHLSLAKAALYSPKLLRKIREHVRGRPAVLIPGEIGPEDLQLAVELNLPLLGAEPDTVALFGSKSGSKRVFAAAEVAVAPGAHDIYDEADLLAYLSRLIVEHLSVQRWLLKIDNESGGRGLAFVDTRAFKLLASIRAEKAQHTNRWHLPEVLANAQERVVVALKKGLSRKAVLATPQLYDGRWENFAAAFYRVGGVIEAAPPLVIGSPSVNLFLEPDGGVRVLSCHDQVFSAPGVFGACNFPSSAPADLIHLPAIAIGKAALREGIIGFVGVDFVAWSAGPGAPPQLWAVDLNLRLTASQASFTLFDFLARGRYVWQQPGISAKERDATPMHLRPPAKYLVRDSTQQDVPASPSRAAGGGAAAARAARENSSRPASGSSTPTLPALGRGGNSVASLRSSQGGGGGFTESERFYSSIPYLYQPHLATLQFGSFFQLCRLRGIAFDVRGCTGVAFVLLDSLASGTLGIIAVGTAHAPAAANTSKQQLQQQLPASPLHAMQTLVEALSFLHEQVSSLRLGAHLYDSEANLQPLLLAYKGLVKAQKEANHMMLLEQQQQQAAGH